MISINPGSGPVASATYENALANMKVLAADASGYELTEVVDSDRGDGRFKFFLCVGDRWHEVEMPGRPLHEVRWMDSSQNIWGFPRLYVDGSSWVWKFAIDALQTEEDG